MVKNKCTKEVMKFSIEGCPYWTICPHNPSPKTCFRKNSISNNDLEREIKISLLIQIKNTSLLKTRPMIIIVHCHNSITEDSYIAIMKFFI
jgi:hypothetical protein